jgi:hypothetical protein
MWADGLTPRSDGLTWDCVDFQSTDGTHPSTSGRDKVAAMLQAFFRSDSVAGRWYNDCSPADTGAFAIPGGALNVGFAGTGAPWTLRWENLAPSSGAATVHDVVTGSLGDLRSTGTFAGAGCAASGLAAASIVDPAADPAPGKGIYYLIRGRNSCGAGTFDDHFALHAPRAALDAASPCP